MPNRYDHEPVKTLSISNKQTIILNNKITMHAFSIMQVMLL